MPLVELAVLCLAQSMLEEQIFPFQQTNYPQKICRDLGKYSTFFPGDSNPSGEG